MSRKLRIGASGEDAFDDARKALNELEFDRGGVVSIDIEFELDDSVHSKSQKEITDFEQVEKFDENGTKREKRTSIVEKDMSKVEHYKGPTFQQTVMPDTKTAKILHAADSWKTTGEVADIVGMDSAFVSAIFTSENSKYVVQRTEPNGWKQQYKLNEMGRNALERGVKKANQR